MGRSIDGFSGVPLALRLEAINGECDRYADADGLRWRVIELEEMIYKARIEKFKAEMGRRKSRLNAK